jgi:hypothetical protein
VSTPARETTSSPSAPKSGDDLDPLAVDALYPREATPDPAPGPLRDALAAVGERRAAANEDALAAPLEAYLDRFLGVVTSRLAGPKARRGTKFWEGAQHGPPREVKALDPSYVVPDKLVTEVEDAIRPVALRVAVDAGADVARRLGMLPDDERGDGMFAVDQSRVEAAVEDAIARILGVARHHADEIRGEITGADADEASLDAVLERVKAAHERGGNWVRMSGRTLANALANEAALREAEALGVTHAQWMCKIDNRVRGTHKVADGQVRGIGDEFQVGSWTLRFPADPKDLPASWAEVAQCRCALLVRRPPKASTDALRLLATDTAPGAAGAAAEKLLRLVPQAADEPTPVTLDKPVAAYRVLEAPLAAVPGQWLALRAPIVLGLVAPAAASETAPVLAVAIPAGAQVVVSNGTVVLAEGSALEVVGATGASIEARLVT